MKSLRERTEIQQAYLDNAEIEYKHTDMSNQKWQKCANEPLFTWNRIDYRIKPKPMEIYVFESESGSRRVVQDGYIANQSGVIKKFIEVIE